MLKYDNIEADSVKKKMLTHLYTEFLVQLTDQVFQSFTVMLHFLKAHVHLERNS